jgi:hypothetical protein
VQQHDRTRTDNGAKHQRSSTSFLKEEGGQSDSNTHAWYARSEPRPRARRVREASRTLRSIWVTVFLQVRFRSLVRQRLEKPLVSEALTGTRRGHTPCKLAR